MGKTHKNLVIDEQRFTGKNRTMRMEIEDINLMRFGKNLKLVIRTANDCENFFIVNEGETGEGYWIGGRKVSTKQDISDMIELVKYNKDNGKVTIETDISTLIALQKSCKRMTIIHYLLLFNNIDRILNEVQRQDNEVIK